MARPFGEELKQAVISLAFEPYGPNPRLALPARVEWKGVSTLERLGTAV